MNTNLTNLYLSDIDKKIINSPLHEQNDNPNLQNLLVALLVLDNEIDFTSFISPFSVIIDYTSKIASLNDDAKSKVMDILDKHNSEDPTLSKEKKQKYIFDSLSQILNELDNYDKVTFYI